MPGLQCGNIESRANPRPRGINRAIAQSSDGVDSFVLESGAKLLKKGIGDIAVVQKSGLPANRAKRGVNARIMGSAKDLRELPIA